MERPILFCLTLRKISVIPVLKRFLKSSILTDMSYQHISSVKTLLSHSNAKDVTRQCGVCLTELAKLQQLLDKRLNDIQQKVDNNLADFIDEVLK